jgi:hypothetical protein
VLGFGGGWWIFSWKYKQKDCWVFPLVEKGFPRIFLVSFVHDYSSCDLGLLQLMYYVAAVVITVSYAKQK